MAKKLRVAVLMGGNSAERQVSLATGRQVLNTLDPEKYEVYALDTASGQKFLPDASEMANPVKMLMTAEGAIEVTTLNDLPQVSPMDRPDVVFIALHGPGGEDGTVQGFLETIGVPYTGSGVLASALAMDKARCKMFLGVESIVTPPGMIYEKRNLTPRRRTSEDVARNLGFPVVVKPSRQGSTYGCTIARDESELAKAMETAFRYDSVLLIEERLVGTEITVAVLGNNDPVVLPIVEIVAKDGFFDYESKYSAGESGAVEIVPARIDDEIKREAQEIALRCHRLLGCRGMSRTDMFVTEDGDIVTLEVNTIPGMTPTSLLPKAAAAAGISFSLLLDKLIEYALEKP